MKEPLRAAYWNRVRLARLVAVLFALWPAMLSAQKPVKPDTIAGPGWIMGTADPVSPDAAAEYFQTKTANLAQAVPQRLAKNAPAGTIAAASAPPVASGSSATEQTSEIVELARGLRYDPKLIFDHVHNHIAYVPYFGSLKGATLTLLDGSGNDFDQASLLIALLRASGYPAQYQFGTMTFPKATLQNWGGSVDYWGSVFSNGGVPVTFSQDNLSATLSRVWVKAMIDGAEYLFDPAFKTYTSTTRINFPEAMGYNRDQVLAAAGGTFTADFSQNLNENAFRAKLTEYTSNLIAYFRAQHPNKSLAELLGRRSIVQTELGVLPTELSNSPVLQSTWDEPPQEYATTIHIVYAGIDVTYRSTELATKRFTLTYTAGDFRPQLKLEGQVVATGNATSQGTVASMTITIDHPFAAKSGTYGDQTTTHSYKSGSSYAICSDFGGKGEQLIRKRQRALDLARAEGAADDSERILGETLFLIGLQWQEEVNLAQGLMADLGDVIVTPFHNIGRAAQEAGYYVDMSNWFGTTTRIVGSSRNQRPFYESSIASSLEHTVLEQLMGTSTPGVSTARLLQIANSSGKKVFYALPGTFAAIRPQLSGYSGNQLDAFQTDFTNGKLKVLVLPEDGQLQFGAWKGAGYIELTTEHNGWIISGNLFGGYSAFQGIVDWFKAVSNSIWNFVTEVAGWIGHFFSADPVEMATGSFTFSSTDLTLGGEAAPLGLAFSRSYSSSQNQSEGDLGKGWRHNLDYRIKTCSHADLGLGARLPVDTAALIVSAWVIMDVLKNNDNLQGWMVSVLASKWATDTLTQNVVAVYQGHLLHEFVKLPDGTYSSPPGSTTQLVKNPDGTFSLVERFGTRTDFGLNERVSKITDVDGNVMNFTYSPDNKLTQASDAFGRILTLTYANGRIASVSDSAGRSAFYGYDGNGNLVSYTDADAKVWTYAYDAEHRMTTLGNPIGVTTASMTYDSTGKVATQTTPRQGGTNATYEFYFSGFRSVERDPTGPETVYFFDEEGKSLGVQNALGHRTARKYDGQNHLVESTDPRGNKTASVYDGNNNLLSVVNAQANAATFAYDAQFRLIERTDPLGNKSQFGYDARHNVTSTRDGEANQMTNTYLPNGFRQTVTDPRGTVSALTYDATGNPATSTVGTHPPVTFGHDAIGRMTSLKDQANAEVRLEYNNRNLVTKKIDRLGKETLHTYDNAGRVISTTDRKGITTIYTYTPGGKVASVTAPGISISYTYDIRDLLVSMQDGIGTTTYAYDAASRLTSMTDPHGFTVGYGYDAAGNVTTLTYPGGKQVTYTYDSLNRLVGVSTWLATQNTASFVYDAVGRPVRMNQFNGTFTTYGFDKANRLLRLENRRSESDSICFYRFTLDGSGNRTRIVQSEPLRPQMPADSTPYAYNAQKNRLLTAGTNSFSYDDEGQLLTNNAVTYTFDALHRLTGVGGTPAMQFAFDGTSRRLRAIRGGVETRYIYDAAGNVLAEADASNTITRYYIHGLGLMAAITPADQLYCYHFNAIGSTVAMTDAGKTVVNAYCYSPFGRLLNSLKALEQPFMFVGAYGVVSDGDTQYHMRARSYDARVGRFISEDPAGFEGGDLNLNAYVGSNPILRNDPSGLHWYGNYLGPNRRPEGPTMPGNSFIPVGIPITPVDFAAFHHDRSYSNAGVGGTWGALTATATWQADLRLAGESLVSLVVPNGNSQHSFNDAAGEVWAVGIVAVFSVTGTYKAVLSALDAVNPLSRSGNQSAAAGNAAATGSQSPSVNPQPHGGKPGT